MSAIKAKGSQLIENSRTNFVPSCLQLKFEVTRPSILTGTPSIFESHT